jgi:hypothetical protein
MLKRSRGGEEEKEVNAKGYVILYFFRDKGVRYSIVMAVIYLLKTNLMAIDFKSTK